MASLLKAFQRTASRFVAFFPSRLRLLTKALAALVQIKSLSAYNSKLLTQPMLQFSHFVAFVAASHKKSLSLS
jgi:hypothetical protein